MAETCTWTKNFDGAWETQCDNAFEVNEGSPLENSMKFCCYCGKPLEEDVYVDEDEQ